MEMQSLTLKKGNIIDAKIKGEFEKILRKYITCTDSQYRCLTRNGTGEVSIIIENGKISQINH